MASYPPPPPGTPGPPPPAGGYPPPPPSGWDPRSQRRYWRDQARAQRAQVRAQAAQWRYQARAQRRGSILAPVLLITVGIVFLLIQTGHIDRTHFWSWYAQWWPLLLVAAGVVVLLEWALDQYHMRQPDAPQYRRSFGGGVTLLVFVFIFTGIAAAHATHRQDWSWFFHGINIDQDSMDEMFGDKHESDQMLDVAFPEGSTLTVVNPRGNVTINGTSDDGRLHIAEHKQVYAHSDSDAESKAQQLSPDVQGSTLGAGGHVSVTLPSLDGARADLVLTVPASAVTMVTANRGDVRIGSIKGNVTANANRGDVELTGITGEATVHINNGHSSLSAHSIDGGLTVAGHAQDLTLAEITGPVNISGDFFGTTHLQHINGSVRFHTSRADIQMARLDGQAEIQRDSDVSADQVMGPLVLNTRNGNVTLDRVAGDVSVTNRNGAIDLTAAPKLGNITMEDRGGSIRVTLPQDASFSVEAVTSDGNVDSDFQLSSSQSDNRKMFRGEVGSGGPMVRLTARDGDVTLHKGDIQPIPPTPPAPPRITMTPDGAAPPAAPRAPRAPRPPRAPRTLQSLKPPATEEQ